MRKKLWLVFILALILRLFALNQSFWLDEATTANVVKYYSFAEIIAKFSPTDFHPPLYYLFLKSWSVLFGVSEISLRFPSLLFSFLTGVMIYFIGKRLKNKEVGFWASAFFLFNPLIVYYSQEARMYLMATFFLTTAIYFLLKIQKTKGVFLVFNLMLVFALFTFYGSLFLIVSMLGYWFWRKQYRTFFVVLLVLGGSVLLLTPLLYQQFLTAQRQLAIVVNWHSVLGAANFKNLLLIPLKFSFGRISFYPKPLYYLISGVWTSVVFCFVVKGGLRNKRLLFLLVMPILIGLVFSFFVPLLQYFRFLYLLPIVSLLCVQGLNVGNRHACSLQKGMMLIGFIILSLTSVFNPAFHREDWRSLVQDVVKDKTVYMVYSSSDPIKYYRPDIVVKDLSELKNVADQKIIVLPYSADIHGVNYQKILQMKKYQLTVKKSFRGLIVEEWRR